MIQRNYIILTGAMGAGKSTVLKQLRERKYLCVDEPARQILQEQRSIKGKGVPETDPDLFNHLMLSRSIHQYKSYSKHKDIVLFDRGVPDFIAYAELLNVNKDVYMNAAKEYQYNKNVFMFNGWKEIYSTDDERKMDYESADKFGMNVKKIYTDLGYNLIDVPFISVERRVEFINGLLNTFKF